MGDSVPDLLGVLRRRHWAVEALAGGTLGRGELVETAGVSRSTAGRGLAELERVGVAEETSEGYRLTLYGQVISEVFERSTARLVGIGEAAGLLARLPRSADIDPGLFEHATVHEGVAARERHGSVVREAEALRGWHWQLALDDAVVYYERALAGTTFRVVFAPPFLERLLTDQHEALEEGLENGDVTVREAETPPYSLLLSEEPERRLCLCVHASDGVLAGLVETTDEDALAWGEKQFEALWADATPLGDP